MCDSELHYLSMYVRREKFKKRSQDQKLLAKGDTEGVTSHSQNNTHSFRPEPPWPALVPVVGEICIGPTLLKSNFSVTSKMFAFQIAF